MAWKPHRTYRSNFYSRPTHLCAVTYITEISLDMTLSYQFTHSLTPKLITFRIQNADINTHQERLVACRSIHVNWWRGWLVLGNSRFRTPLSANIVSVWGRRMKRGFRMTRSVSWIEFGFQKNHACQWSLHDFPVNKYNVILVAEISLNSERDIRPKQNTVLKIKVYSIDVFISFNTEILFKTKIATKADERNTGMYYVTILLI